MGIDKITYFESPFGMFQLTGEVFFRYCKDVSASDFILLVFLLYHLREQVVEGQGYEHIQEIRPTDRTDEQELFVALWEMVPFQIIRELCNGSKHHKIDKQVSVSRGFTCGVGRCGDRLGQTIDRRIHLTPSCQIELTP